MQDQRELRRIQEDLAYERQRAAEAIDQLDRLREKAQSEQEERRRERRWEMERSLRQTDNWRSAIEAQRYLMAREVPLEDELRTIDDDPIAAVINNYFGSGSAACERALELWDEEAARIQPQIEALQSRIEALQRQIRHTVGERLGKESQGRSGWDQVARNLAGDEFEDPSEWLNW